MSTLPVLDTDFKSVVGMRLNVQFN